jgi:RNA polymerase sigma-70 factor (sigma-E family)
MQAQEALGPGGDATAWVEQWLVGKRSGELERDREVAALFDEHYDGLCRLAYLIVGDAHLGEEIVMEALLKVYTGWGRIRDRSQSSAYLRRSVVNLCRSKIRRKMIETRVNAQHHHAEEIRPPRWDPDRHETQREVWDAVRQLPARQRAAIVLHYEEDLPDAEIAVILDCSVSTVRSQLSRARDKLAKMLKPEEAEGAVR